MNEFKPFDDKLAGLIGTVPPSSRRWLAAEIAKQLRAAQQQRIRQQKALDGTQYQARKRQPLRAKKGRIKRAMFQKLRVNRYMKASGRNDTTVVEFTDKVQRFAQVQQYWLKDQPNPHSQDVQYQERKLLGFSPEDKRITHDIIFRIS